MHGLTKLQHNIVSNVYYVTDGAHAAGTQTALHPFGGFGNFNILQNAGCKARAQLRSVNFNAYIISSIATGSFLNIQSRHFQGTAGNSANLPSQTDNAEAISTVAGEVNVDNSIIKA